MATKLTAADLRVGNYLQKDNGSIYTVKRLIYGDDDILVNEEAGLVTLNYNLQPIQLTEEWHNKFGVTKNKKLSFIYKIKPETTLSTSIVFSGDYVYLTQGEQFDLNIVTIWNKDLAKRDMFVHEFQNLIYALTNTELTIKDEN